MKKLIVFIISLSLTNILLSQNIGIGTSTPDASAKLDVVDASRGFLAPRVSIADVNVFGLTGATGTEGMMMYNTNPSTIGGTGKGYYYWNGTKWKKMSVDENLSDVGVIVAFPGTSYPNDLYLPLNGGTYNLADYPEFASIIPSLDNDLVSITATTFTLANWNADAIFLRSVGTNSAALGVLQNDATAAPNTSFTTAASTTSSDGSHNHTFNTANNDVNSSSSQGYPAGNNHLAFRTTDRRQRTEDNGTIISAGAHTHTIPALSVGGGDVETRPINRAITWFIKVKPSNFSSANTTINNINAADADWYKVGTSVAPNAITDNIYTQGNVGIGVTNPTEKLEVAGNIIANNIWMKVADIDVSSSTGVTISGLDGSTQRAYKVIFQGTLNAGGTDRHLLIRPNGISSGYSSYAIYNGTAGGSDWNTTGFYVGRNGWGQNADVFFEYEISTMTGRKRLGLGKATFAHTSGNILGYADANGYWNDISTNITSLWVGPTGGTITGKIIVYATR